MSERGNAVADLARVLYEPVAVFQRSKASRPLLTPFLVLAVALFLVGVLRLPFERAATSAMLARFEPGYAPAAPGISSYVIVAFLRAVLGLAASVAFTGMVLWIALVLSGIATSLKTLLIVATYAGTVRIVFALAVLAVLVLRGAGSVTSSADLTPSLGLDLLLPEGAPVGPGLSAALAQLSVFSLWGAYLVGLGVKITHGLRRSWILVAAALVLGLPFLYHIIVASHLGGAPPSFIQRVEQ